MQTTLILVAPPQLIQQPDPSNRPLSTILHLFSNLLSRDSELAAIIPHASLREQHHLAIRQTPMGTVILQG
jgi:hypothetical protein